MAYRRYKKRYRRRPVKKGGAMKAVANAGTVASTAYSAMRLASSFARLINVEKKHYDTSGVSDPATYDGEFIPLSSVPQDETDDTRNGNSIKPLHITLRGQVEGNTAEGTPIEQHIRVIIIRAKNENTAPPTPAELLETVGTQYATLSPKFYINRFHSKVLYDRLFKVSRSDATLGTNFKHMIFSKKLFGHINFSGSATDVEDGGIYLYVFGDKVSNGPTFRWYSRMSYTDN